MPVLRRAQESRSHTFANFLSPIAIANLQGVIGPQAYCASDRFPAGVYLEPVNQRWADEGPLGTP